MGESKEFYTLHYNDGTMLPVSDRIAHMRDRVRNRVITVDDTRLKIATDVRQNKCKNMPPMIYRAQATHDILAAHPVVIEDFEVVFGNFGTTFCGTEIWPEDGGSEWYFFEIANNDFWRFDEEMDAYVRELPAEKLILPKSVYNTIEETRDFWRDNCITAKLNAYVPEWGPEILYDDDATIMGPPPLGFCTEGHMVPGFEKIIKVGYKAIKKVATDWMDAHRGYLMGDDADKWMFYKSAVLACDGAMAMIKNYAKEAYRLAEICEDPDRKAELLSRAESMEWISENPARTFWEAIQAHVFYNQAIQLEHRPPANGMGRLDQYWWPFLEKELNEGSITMEQAQEIIDGYCLKLHCFWHSGPSQIANATGMGVTYQHVTIAGVDRDTGEDATNPVSYMFLNSLSRLLIHDPTVSVRFNKNSPAELWEACITAAQYVGGLPLFQNDEVLIPAMVEAGYELRDARDYAFIGCQEAVGCGNDMPYCNSHNVRVSVLLTCALNNGINPLTGKAGSYQSGYLYEMESFEEVKNAFLTQLKLHQDAMVSMMNWGEMLDMWYRPHALLSIGLEGCMESGVDCTAGGAKYNSYGGSNHGFATVADSLTTIKWACFDKKICTTRELYDAWMDNWEGHEELRQTLLNDCPHYGNDDPYADEQMAWCINNYYEILSHYHSKRCKFFRPGLYSGSAHVEEGMMCFATPDGRLSGLPVADATSPAQGRDVNGPTSIFNSTLCFDHHPLLNGMALNIKISPSSLAGDGKGKLIDMVQSYFERGGLEVQFNMVGTDVMKKAKADPDNYRDLVVRIAGFSAYIVELTPEQQTDVISRNEHMF